MIDFRLKLDALDRGSYASLDSPLPSERKDLSEHTNSERTNNGEGNSLPPIAASSPSIVTRKDKDTSPEDLEKTRAFIVKELYTTEVNYLKALLTAVNGYYIPMRNSALREGSNIPLEAVRTIFQNIETILPLNQDLLKRLQERVQAWTPLTTIGDVFKKWAPFLKIYTLYSNNYDDAMDALDQAERDQWLIQFCDKKVTIESLLITPIQRIPRYTLLLTDLWNNTPEDHPDFQDLEIAIKLTKEVADHVNKQIKTMRDIQRLTQEGYGYLLGPARNLILDGDLQVISISHGTRGVLNSATSLPGLYRFLLFNDVLVHVNESRGGFLIKKTKKKELIPRRGEKSRVKKKKEFKPTRKSDPTWIWPLELIWVVDGGKTNFNIIGPNKILTLSMDSEEEKEEWMKHLKTHVESCLSRQLEELGANAPADFEVSVNGKRRIGKHAYPNGEVYHGQWSVGEVDGHGILRHGDYFIYEGQFMEGKRTGEGSLVYSDGTVYIGSFVDGKPEGQGETTSPSGTTYVGHFTGGNRHGLGDLIWCNGDYYIGEFVNGQIEGSGLLKTSNGICYEGLFKEGQFHGKGVLETPWCTYEGQFDFGKKQGTGIIKYNDQSIYEGEWKDDRFHGKGKHSTLQYVYEGDFVRGKREGHGKCEFFSGAIYEGPWKDGKEHGSSGVFIDPSNWEHSYDGEWENGQRNGKGVLSYQNGTKWEGTFVNHKPVGNGKMTYENGTIVTAKWKAGLMEFGRCELTTKESSITLDKDDPTRSVQPPLDVPFVNISHLFN
jgi:hypothetical protein